MPPQRKQKPPTAAAVEKKLAAQIRLATEKRLQEAVAYVESLGDEFISDADVCKKFNVHRNALRRRLDGGKSRYGRIGAGKRMTEEMEKAFFWHVKMLELMGIAPTITHCRAAICRLMGLNSADVGEPEDLECQFWADDDGLVDKEDEGEGGKGGSGVPLVLGPNYLKRLLKRLGIRVVKQRSRELAREVATEPEVFRKYFNDWRHMLKKYGVVIEDVWNFDESGFQTGLAGDVPICTTDAEGAKDRLAASTTSRESVTVFESVSMTGKYIPPFIIFKGHCHMESHFVNTLPKGTVFYANPESHVTNDMIGLKFIRHFNQWSEKVQVGKWRVLLMDGHGSHETIDFTQYCWDHCILPFKLPPHTTHLTQPLDLTVFRPMKLAHKLAIDDAARRGGCLNFDKGEFFFNLQKIRLAGLKKNTIKSGWRHAGLHPFNPNAVLSKFCTVFISPDDDWCELNEPLEQGAYHFAPPPRAETPPPQNPGLQSSPPRTPQNVFELTAAQSKINSFIDEYDCVADDDDADDILPSPVRTMRKRFDLMRKSLKYAVVAANAGELMTSVAEEMTAKIRGQKERKAMKKRTGTQPGLMLAGTGRAIEEHRKELEEEIDRAAEDAQVRRHERWCEKGTELVMRRENREERAAKKAEEQLEKERKAAQKKADKAKKDADVAADKEAKRIAKEARQAVAAAKAAGVAERRRLREEKKRKKAEDKASKPTGKGRRRGAKGGNEEDQANSGEEDDEGREQRHAEEEDEGEKDEDEEDESVGTGSNNGGVDEEEEDEDGGGDGDGPGGEDDEDEGDDGDDDDDAEEIRWEQEQMNMPDPEPNPFLASGKGKGRAAPSMWQRLWPGEEGEDEGEESVNEMEEDCTPMPKRMRMM